MGYQCHFESHVTSPCNILYVHLSQSVDSPHRRALSHSKSASVSGAIELHHCEPVFNTESLMYFVLYSKILSFSVHQCCS